MILRSLYLRNFRSFRGEQTFDFPSRPGLYFMYGDNQAEPRLEGNGAGKSTVWEALAWLFFEKTSKGLKAGTICNWDVTKGTEVELTYEVEQPAWMQYTVRRTWGPNSWTMNDGMGGFWDLAKDETNLLREHVRLDFAPFLSSILMAQGKEMFLDLKAEPKAALFAEVMQLDRWLEYSDRALAAARGADRSIAGINEALAADRGRLDALRASLLRDDTAEWEEERMMRLFSIEKEYEGLLGRQRHLVQRALDLEAKAARAREAHKEEIISTAAAEALRDIAKAAEARRGNKRCPTCNGPISDHLDGAIAVTRAAEVRLKDSLLDVADAQAELSSCNRDIASIDKTLDMLEGRSEEAEKESNPHQDRKAHTERQVGLLEVSIEGLSDDAESHAADQSLATSWARWFKDIRLGLISEALEQLELEVNSCVTRLGLCDWQLLFDVDKETAKGTLTRGFTVSVVGPKNPKPVPWEAWSGGESQRLRLAANMGLANLIRSRTGTSLNLEVWDEPTQWMSAQGVQDLLQALEQRAREEQRQIWVVDHRTLGYAGFTGAVRVVKTGDGSRFDLTGLYLPQGAERAGKGNDALPVGRSVHDVPRRRNATPR